jgi:starch synthase
LYIFWEINVRKILFASSEVHPLMKTGGLADVSSSLPKALHEEGQDVRVLMPAYRQCLEQLDHFETVATIKLAGYYLPVEILETRLPGTEVILWLLHSPHHFDRQGGPYNGPDGQDWYDNAARFALLSRAAAAIAMNQAGLEWQPDILHCNDWQTGLAPALIHDLHARPYIVFTIHNLAYQGVYNQGTFEALDLPAELWQPEGVEYYGQMSFMKGGLIYADHINTVSQTYADEICTEEYGYGLQGLLSHKAEQGQLSGILNGIDYQEWDPEQDPHLVAHFSADKPEAKADNKAFLQKHFGLPQQPDTLVIALISRLVYQKGIDIAVAALRRVLTAGHAIQFVCLGSGEQVYEQEVRALCAEFPHQASVVIGYDEPLSHQMEAGADAFLMPSRFEPCGLNQMYSLRYGTLPIVRHTGGLADTVVDLSVESRKVNKANGFSFVLASADAIEQTLVRAVETYQDTSLWHQMMAVAMQRDFSWQHSAKTYITLYDKLAKR